MPVYKFESHKEAEKALWNFNPDEAYYKRVAELWYFANRLSDIQCPQGVVKFKSIADANRHREELEPARAKDRHRR